MKTLRRLALLSLFAAAGTAAAQDRPTNLRPTQDIRPGDSRPSPTTTADKWADVVPIWFKETTIEGKGDARTFLLPAMPHTLDGGKGEKVFWSVFFRLHQRADRPATARIFFPCKAVPADAHPDRLADLMNMNGAIQDSPAYFVITGSGKNRMLALVSEMPAAGLDRDTLEIEIKGLFRAAERTMDLWDGDLSKPPVKAAGKKADGLVGKWNQTKFNLADKNEGVVGLTLNDDGTGEVDEYEVSNAPPTGKPGKYTLKGDELTFTTKGGTVFAFTVKQVGDDLTVTYKQDGETVTRTFARKK